MAAIGITYCLGVLIGLWAAVNNIDPDNGSDMEGFWKTFGVSWIWPLLLMLNCARGIKRYFRERG